jgi:hypothetical protein
MVLPSVGGTTYNLRVGDPECGWEADHVEPSVSLENKENDLRYGQGANAAFIVPFCVGNEAKVVTGGAKSAKGVVTGKHDVVNHVLADFQPETLEKLLISDKVLVKAFGLGLRLLDYPEITVMNTDPHFLKALNLKPEGSKLKVSVAYIVPASIVSSGSGMNQVYAGDYDIQPVDKKVTRQYELEDLRLDDLVAMIDADHQYGRLFRQGALSVGIVVHTNCVTAGHGPGHTTLFTSSNRKIVPKIDARADIASILKLRTDI